MAKRRTADPEKVSVPYHEQIANKLIEQLKAGTAPWQKPWTPGTLRLPHNPVSGTKYRGSNTLWLEMQGRGDPRWMTYKQAASVDAQVKKGEHGTIVQYWKFRDEIAAKDEQGRPLKNEEGKQVYRYVELERPKTFTAVVFNAEQIEGLPALEIKPPTWDPLERAEAILQASGADIRHDQENRAFYRPATDRIHLPEKTSFPTADGYYATALHEVGHWTGHPSRLDRDLAHPFGSEGYAKEELRAEIASLMLGDEIGVGHDPAQHASYVSTWIKVLQEEPKEILKASRDAERITGYLLGLERDRSTTATPEATPTTTLAPTATVPVAAPPTATPTTTPTPDTPTTPQAPPAPTLAAPLPVPTAEAPNPSAQPEKIHVPNYLSEPGQKLAAALARQDLKGAIDTLRPLSLRRAQIAAIEAGLSIGGPKNKPAFFADIQPQLLAAMRPATRVRAPQQPAAAEQSPDLDRDR